MSHSAASQADPLARAVRDEEEEEDEEETDSVNREDAGTQTTSSLSSLPRQRKSKAASAKNGAAAAATSTTTTTTPSRKGKADAEHHQTGGRAHALIAYLLLFLGQTVGCLGLLGFLFLLDARFFPCFLFFIFFGLHHLYLQRYMQAFFWAISFSCLGLGAINDFFYLRQYVERYNGNYKVLRKRVQEGRRPGVLDKLPLCVAQVVLAIYLRSRVLAALPDFTPADRLPYHHVLLPLLSVVSVTFTVAALGRTVGRTGSVKLAFVGALIGAALFYHFKAKSDLWMVLFSVILHAMSIRYHPPAPVKRLRSFALVALGVLIFSGLSASWLYHNAYVVNDNETVRIRDFVQRITHSHDWQAYFDAIFSSADLRGFARQHRERASLLALGLGDDADAADVRKAYRERMRKYHPDRCTLDTDVCTKKYEEVRLAYEYLSEVRDLQGSGEEREDDERGRAHERGTGREHEREAHAQRSGRRT